MPHFRKIVFPLFIFFLLNISSNQAISQTQDSTKVNLKQTPTVSQVDSLSQKEAIADSTDATKGFLKVKKWANDNEGFLALIALIITIGWLTLFKRSKELASKIISDLFRKSSEKENLYKAEEDRKRAEAEAKRKAEQQLKRVKAEAKSQAEEKPKPPHIFLCHASEDKARVLEIYGRFKQKGLKPWLDKQDLLPGQNWSKEIRKAIRSSEFVLIFFQRRLSASVAMYRRNLNFH